MSGKCVSSQSFSIGRKASITTSSIVRPPAAGGAEAADAGVMAALSASRDWRAASALRVDTSSRSEEHTSELQSLMRISYDVFCLKKNSLNATYYSALTKHSSTE